MNAAARPYLEQIREILPAAFAGPCAENSAVTLGQISRSITAVAPPPAPQDAEDFITLAGQEASRLLGESAGADLVRGLEESFVVTTANHHGLDTHPEFIQGVIVFALARLMGAAGAGGIVPVLSTGEVPMSNMSFPQGIFLGRPKRQDRTAYAKFSLFRPGSRKTLVSLQPPFTTRDIALARQRLCDKPFLPFEREMLQILLEDVCSSHEVLAQTSYADQATVFNARVWPRLFSDRVEIPRLLELDKAELAHKLIIKDMADEQSLIHMLLFTPEVRNNILAALNRTLGCWTCSDAETWAAPDQGTVFFWGIDAKGRAFPLGLNSQNEFFSADHPGFRLALNPADMREALATKSIMPGLYLSFVVLAIARGLMCCGGAYQTGYLVDMRNRTASALAGIGEQALAQCIGALPSAPMTTGFMPLRFAGGESAPYPAGPVEIMAAGGLTPVCLESIAKVSAREAFVLYLACQYEDIVPAGKRIPQWCEHFAPHGGVVLGPAQGKED